MKKAVVTGGAGFIGSHLAETLVRQSYQVIVLDDLSTGKIENLKSLPQESVEFTQGSVTDLSLLQRVFTDVDYVFHQAALPSVPRSVENPLSSHEVNVTGTLNVLWTAKEKGVRKVIYASSCSVYGDSPALPKREDMTPNPRSPYAVTKLAGEYYCRLFQEVYHLPTVCLRYFNVYGPRQNPDAQYAAVIPAFISRVAQGSPPVIFGDGEQTRDFVFIEDVVSANILSAESNATGIFNIGQGNNISINRLAELIAGLMGKKIKPVHQAPRPGDVKHSLADITKARVFGYAPKYDLEQGLTKLLQSQSFK